MALNGIDNIGFIEYLKYVVKEDAIGFSWHDLNTSKNRRIHRLYCNIIDN